MTFRQRAIAHLHAERDRANAGIDVFADFRAALDSGRRVIVPELIGVLMSDMPEYARLVDRALFDEGYMIQRHSLEGHGEAGETPMFVRRGM